MAPGRAGDWGGEVLRGSREVALTGGARRDFHVGSLARAQPVAQRVEDLALGETAHSRGIVGRQIARPGPKARLRPRCDCARPDQELLLPGRQTGEPALARGIVSAAVAPTACM